MAKGKDGRDYPELVWKREHVYRSEISYLSSYRAEGLRFNLRVCRWVYTDPIMTDRTEKTWTIVVHDKFGKTVGPEIKDFSTRKAASLYAYDLDRWGY